MKYETKVLEVKWNETQNGRLFPLIYVESVIIDGVEVKKASGKCAEFIKEHHVGRGCIVNLSRSNDTIPDISKVLVKGDDPKFPKKDFIWKGKHIYLKNIDENENVKIKCILKFFRTIDIEGLSEGNVNRMYKAGFTTVHDIINMDIDDYLTCEGFKKRLSTKIKDNIFEKIHKDGITVLQVMVGSNAFGEGFAEKKLIKILKTFPNIVKELTFDNFDEDNFKEELEMVDGFSEKTITKFLTGLPKFHDFIKRLIEECKAKIIKFEEKIVKDDKFENKTFVFTGFTNKEWKAFIEERGGKVSTSVSKNTFMVIHVENSKAYTNSKYLKAKELGLELLTKSEFESQYID
jgi:DNA ligase (NAD+)